jgi:chromosome segregation ATPase
MEDRLSKAIASRDALRAKSQRIAGLKEAAEKNLRDIEQEIRSHNLDPDSLPDTIKTLKESYESELSRFESQVESARSALSKFEDK